MRGNRARRVLERWDGADRHAAFACRPGHQLGKRRIRVRGDVGGERIDVAVELASRPAALGQREAGRDEAANATRSRRWRRLGDLVLIREGLLRRSGGLLAVCAVCMLAAGQVLAAPLSRLYVGYDPGLFRMTSHAFSIFSFSFLFSGFAIYGSSFFTALNDGLTSAIIAFLRTLVFQVGAVLTFPLLWKLDGIWLSIVAAEVMAVITTAIFLVVGRKRYGY